MEILSLTELRKITMSIHFKKMRKELNNLGIPYRTLSNGLPVVLKKDVEKKISTKEETWNPNF